MKRILLFQFVLVFSIVSGLNRANAQSEAAITKPEILGDTLLCPNSSGVLFTQKTYDTYQWYKRDYFSDEKKPIPGATSFKLKIDNDDVLQYFSVKVTLKGTKRSSEEKLVDGLVFASPSVRSGGDFKNGPGFFVLRQGDTGVFDLLEPYTTNITWYKDGNAIPGETKHKLRVTEAGSYTVSGAPAECPNYIQYLGVDLIVKVRKTNKKPVITGDSLLCPNSTGKLTVQAGYQEYQWYKRYFGTNKRKPVKGATTNTISVDANTDAPAYFSVSVLSNGDTLTSEEKLVDSYAFLPPAVISDGDFKNGAGYFILHKGDTGTFTLTQPYDTNITWYRNNAALKGKKDITLDVTRGGDYTVNAAPAVCPDYIQNLGVILTVKLVAADNEKVLNASQHQFKQVSAYPNPAKDYVLLNTADFEDNDIEVSLTNNTGKTITVKKFLKVAASTKLNLSSVANGIYYVKITNGAQQQTLKLVVAK